MEGTWSDAMRMALGVLAGVGMLGASMLLLRRILAQSTSLSNCCAVPGARTDATTRNADDESADRGTPRTGHT